MNSNAKGRNLVVACLEYHPRAIILLRIARNRALQIGGRWRAIFVESPQQAILHSDNESREKMLRLLAHARQTGGETMDVTASNSEEAVLDILEKEKENIALLLLSKADSKRPLFTLHRTLNDRISRRANKYHIPVETVRLYAPYYKYPIFAKLRSRLLPVLYALITVGLAYFTTHALQNLFPLIFEPDGQNIKPLYMLFMVACAYSASRYGLVPGIIASAASFVAINYLLTSSFHFIHPANPAVIFNMGIFLFAVLLISLVTSRTHEVAQQAAKRELSTQVLFNLYRIASSTTQSGL